MSPAELLHKAQSNGKVRVIVGLNTRFQPDSQLSAPQAQAQQNAIAQSRLALVQSLAPDRAQVLAHSNQWSIPYVALQVDAVGLQQLQASSQVTSIQEDKLNFRTNNTASLNNMGIPPAWANGYDGHGYTVAILDDGIQASHSFLGGRVVAEACYSTGDYNFIDAFGRKYITKTLCSNGTNTQTGPGSSDPATCINLARLNSLDENCDHGTHVAGIAAGNDMNNGTLNDGVARGANIIGVQIFSYADTTCANCDFITSWDTDIISGLNYVYNLRNDYQITSVNMSLGGKQYNSQTACDTENAATKAAIDQLRAVNIATVIASGNEYGGSFISAPGCISSAIAVGSVSDAGEYPGYRGGKISTFTNANAMLDLLASGYNIYSSVTVPTNTGFGYKSGTSMATPQVTGAWALARQALPSATVSQVLRAFQDSGTPVKDDVRADGYRCGASGSLACSNLTYKLINVNAAIQIMMTPSPVPFLNLPDDIAVVSSQPTLSWQPSPGASSYILEIASDVNFQSLVSGYPLPVTGTSHVPVNGRLVPGQRYYWHVCALNPYGGPCSAFSTPRSFAVDLAPERDFYAVPPPLTWTSVTWAAQYEVEIASNPAFTTNVIKQIVYSTTLPLMGLSLPDGKWYWHVRAIKSDGLTGLWSRIENFTLKS